MAGSAAWLPACWVESVSFLMAQTRMYLSCDALASNSRAPASTVNSYQAT